MRKLVIRYRIKKNDDSVEEVFWFDTSVYRDEPNNWYNVVSDHLTDRFGNIYFLTIENTYPL
jgi:hypothetical protein